MTDDAEAYRPIFDEAIRHGTRIGWLDLRGTDLGLSETGLSEDGLSQDRLSVGERRKQEPPGAAAVAAGARRAVSVDEGRTVSLKPRRGPAVLDDLLREHFLGCCLVLARGPATPERLLGGEEALGELSTLVVGADGSWILDAPGGGRTQKTTEAFVAALRRPRPWS